MGVCSDLTDDLDDLGLDLDDEDDNDVDVEDYEYWQRFGNNEEP